MERDRFTIVGICLTLIIGAYSGAYFLCVQPPKPWSASTPPMPPYAQAVKWIPSYRFGGRFVNSQAIRQLFAPLHSLDIKLRPDRWTVWIDEHIEETPPDPYEAVRQDRKS